MRRAERPKDDCSDAGAIDFSAHADQMIVATSGGAPLDDFLAISTASCKGCIASAQDIGPSPTEAQRFDGPPTIDDAGIVKTGGADHVVEQNVSLPGGRRIRLADSSVVSQIDPAVYRWFVDDYSVERTS